MIRKANISDASAIAHIRIDSWRTAYKGLIPDSFLNGLDYKMQENKVMNRINGTDKNFTSNILVYEEENEILGYTYYGKALDSLNDKYQGEVVALYVRPDKKRNGIGTQLINKVKELLKEEGYSNMIIWCLKGNDPSVRFYEHVGGGIKEEREYEIEGLKVQEIGIVYELNDWYEK